MNGSNRALSSGRFIFEVFISISKISISIGVRLHIRRVGEKLPWLTFRWWHRRSFCTKLTVVSKAAHRCTSRNHRLTIFAGNVGKDLVETAQPVQKGNRSHKGFTVDITHRSPLPTFPARSPSRQGRMYPLRSVCLSDTSPE